MRSMLRNGCWALLTMLATSASAGPAEEDALRTFALAYGAYKDGLDTLAEEQLRGFLERFPQDERCCDVWFLLGDVLCRTARRQEGMAAYEKVYGNQSCKLAIDARMRAAAELRAAGERRKAVQLLLEVSRAAPEGLACEAGLQACELLLGLEDWTELERSARAAAARCLPTAPTALYRALAHSGLGQPELAAELAGEALAKAKQPEDRRRALLLRAESRFKLGQMEAAVADLEPALDFEPSRSGDLLLALARFEIGPPAAAVEAFRRFALRQPDHPRLAGTREQLLKALAGTHGDRELLGREVAGLRAEDLAVAQRLALAGQFEKQGWRAEAASLLGTCPETPCQLALGAAWLAAERPEQALRVAEGLTGLEGAQEDERRMLSSAALVQLGRSEEAAAVYGDVADSAASPTTAQRAMLLLAQLHADLQHWPETVVAAQSLLIRSPTADLDRPARLLLAEAYLRSGQLARGATVLEELAPRAEGAMQGEVLRRLALAYVEQGDHASAVPHLERLVERMEPGSTEWGRTVLELGQAHLKAGDSERGRSVLQSAAARLPPESQQGREILLGVAALYAGEGSYNLAAEQFARLLPGAATGEERSTLALRLAEAYYRTERFAEAIRALGEVDLQGTHRLAALLELGLCHERLGQFELAAAAFEQLFASGSGRSDAARHLLRLARRAAEEGQAPLARSLLEKVLGSGATEVLAEARFDLAGLELSEGRVEEGLRLLRQNTTDVPADARWACLSFLRAAAAVEAEGKWDLAEALYQELLHRYPGDQMAPFARNRLRQVQRQAGRPSTLDKDLDDRPPMGSTAEALKEP